MATEKRKKYIFIIDDHPAFRAGIRSILEPHPQYSISGESGSCEAARNQMKLVRVDLLMLDVGLPGQNGIGFIAESRKIKPEAKVLILTMHRDWDFLNQARWNGAAGYLLKESKPEEILNAVIQILGGHNHFPDEAMPPSPPHIDPVELQKLSGREKEIMFLIGQGFTNQEIASQLGISKRTVESHRFHITEKLALDGPAALLRLALNTRKSPQADGSE